jgi:V8-like Glu-specific endopeptidase
MKNLVTRMTLTLLAAGCADAVEHETAETTPTAIHTEKHLNGLRYIPLRENHPEAYSLERAVAHFAGAERKDSAPKRDIAELSDSELIARMSGLTLIGNWIYRVEPELETVRAARRAPRQHAGNLGERSHEAGDVGALAAPLALEIPVTGRHLERNNTEYPYSTMVWLNQSDPPGFQGGGTGVMIGRFTMLSAAHVFYDGSNFRWFYLIPGVDAQDANYAPFGGTDCYGVVVAASDDIVVENDYAVVDFHYSTENGACTDSPGDATGWMGVPSYSANELDGMTASVYGYPIDHDPYPQLWGGSGRLVSYDSKVIWFVDTTEGQSGGPVYVTGANGWPGVVSLVSRTNPDTNPPEHQGVLIDNDVNLNINAWSSEF